MHRGEGGAAEPVLTALAVCALHEAKVSEWAASRAVSDGIAVDIKDSEDLVRMMQLGGRYEPAQDRRVSNLDGGVTLLAS